MKKEAKIIAGILVTINIILLRNLMKSGIRDIISTDQINICGVESINDLDYN